MTEVDVRYDCSMYRENDKISVGSEYNPDKPAPKDETLN